MRSVSVTLSVVAVALLASGCTAYTYSDIFDAAVYGPHRSRNYDRVHDDARRHVRYLDRELRLDRRQAERIHRILVDRTYRLLDQTRPRDHRYVYPFPRRFDRDQPSVTRRWWARTDRSVASVLSRRQKEWYREMVRDGDRRRGKHGRRGTRRN